MVSQYLSNNFFATSGLCLLNNFRPFLNNHFLINAIGNAQWFVKADKPHIFRVFDIVTAYVSTLISDTFGKYKRNHTRSSRSLSIRMSMWVSRR